MSKTIRYLLPMLVLALCLGPGVGASRLQSGAVTPIPPRSPRVNQFAFQETGIHVPSLLPTSWSDSFKDDAGVVWMENASVREGGIGLSEISALGFPEEGGAVLAMTEASNGRIYLGTDGAYLNVYDPGAGTIVSLGAPVPDECFG